ncbi:TraB/GumN family protein [Rhodobacter sp. Har01]|uniref:TraB/GumN family protein n=1 Tax=Rhodobacter sp. Har01 TaxID=2883999 RepID=UPI001D0990C6|nr:TraB/GumN family protein [Rhodobacter sp. Har01]MCB6179199.1 TraB/GumN family protein [Rhodobacter sp. Har01]
MRALIACLLSFTLLAAAPARAACYGMNLLDLMPAEDRARIEAAAAAVPFPEGNLWTARKGDQSLTVVGTYHLDDPRHDATLARLTPLVEEASALLVEAGPEEEKQLLDRIARDPSVMMITEGPTLIELLPPETWTRLKQAMSARGIPGFMAAKFQPWYVTVMLSVPPCAMSEMTQPKGLDGLLIDAAKAAEIPVRALEPYDTVFTIFELFNQQDQVAMIDQTLIMEPASADFSATLADAYFDGQSQLTWELMREQSYAMPGYTRAQVDAEMAALEEVLISRRNLSWIPVIDAAAAQGPLVVAFGALHLPGEKGVLNLLAQDGWTVTPLPLP